MHAIFFLLGSVVTGLLCSLGPCTAPRMIGLCSASVRGRFSAVAYLAGIVTAYAGFALGVGAVTQVLHAQTVILRVLAGGAIIAGVYGLIRPLHSTCAQRQAPKIATPRFPALAPFAFGASSVCVLAPCCSPFLAALVYGSASGGAVLTAASLMSFAIGQHLPLAGMGFLRKFAQRFTSSPSFHDAVQLFQAGMSLALGGYYALLAA